LLWLYAVAANVAAHQRRSMARGARLDSRLRSVPSEGPEEPEPQVVRRADYDRVLAAAGRLRPADQEILRLAAWEELPHDQISRLLGCSVAAVDQRLHRAKKRLAKEYRKTHVPGQPQTEEGGGS
jgi:RNA polymerase sigma-70 factor (ECF subfamily)